MERGHWPGSRYTLLAFVGMTAALFGLVMNAWEMTWMIGFGASLPFLALETLSTIITIAGLGFIVRFLVWGHRRSEH